MSRTITVDGTDVTALTRVDSWALQMKAHAGEVAAGSIIFDDVTGVADPAAAMKAWVVEESEATPTVIAGGYIGERRPDRGPLTVAAQRQWQPVLEDYNAALMDRVLKGRNARRRSETDVARITWLVGRDALGMFDGFVVSSVDPEDMERTNYRGKYPFDVLNDCAENANKNFYAYYQDGTGWVLYYGPWNTTGAEYTSDLQISDVAADIDSTITFGASNISYELDPARIYSRLAIKWRRGWVVVHDATTESTYRNRQKTVVRENFRTASRARTWGERQLAKLDQEVKRLSLTVDVPASALGQLRAGMRILVKLTHVGITAYTYFRIVDATYRWVTDDRYRVDLVMRDKIRAVNIGDIYGDPETTIASGGSGSGGVGNEGDDEGEVADMDEYAFEDWADVIAPAAGNVVDIGTIPTHDGDGAWFEGGEAWSVGSGHPSITVEVAGQRLSVSFPGATARQYFPVLVEAEEGDLPSEGTWLFGVETSALRTASGVLLGLETPASSDQMQVGVRFGLGDIYVRWQSAAGSDIATQAVAYSIDTDYSVRWEVAYGILRARIWVTGDTEPTAWTVSLAHSEAIAGGIVALGIDGGSGGAQIILVDPIYIAASPLTGQRVERMTIGYGDGVSTTYTLPQGFVPGSLVMWVGGIATAQESDDPAAPSVTFDASVAAGIRIEAAWTAA